MKDTFAGLATSLVAREFSYCVGSYFGRQRFEDTVERNGLSMHFAGWMQPLENYAAALEGAGLAITSLREPIPSLSSGAPANMERWTRWPMFLWLKARPLAR